MKIVSNRDIEIQNDLSDCNARSAFYNFCTILIFCSCYIFTVFPPKYPSHTPPPSFSRQKPCPLFCRPCPLFGRPWYFLGTMDRGCSCLEWPCLIGQESAGERAQRNDKIFVDNSPHSVTPWVPTPWQQILGKDTCLELWTRWHGHSWHGTRDSAVRNLLAVCFSFYFVQFVG